jgi:hypothetical protein
LCITAKLVSPSRLPAIYPFRQIVEAGGLMSYGVDLVDLGHRLADMVDQIPEKGGLSLSATNRRTAAQQRSVYSITSSAVASSSGGTVRPSAFAALRLMASTNLVGWKMGMSAGLVPFRRRKPSSLVPSRALPH